MKKKMKTKYMMATTGIHKAGDISRDTPNICEVFREDEENFYGNWVCGFGFVDVKFPKSTTRELTKEEIEKYHGKLLAIGNSFWGVINITGEDFRKKVIITKKSDNSIHSGELIGPIKVGNVVALFVDDGSTFHTSTIQSINENEIKTKNSTYIIEYL